MTATSCPVSVGVIIKPHAEGRRSASISPLPPSRAAQGRLGVEQHTYAQ